MLQRRDLLLAGSETYRKTSLLGAPFEPKVSVTVPMKVTVSGSSIQAAPAAAGTFSYQGVSYDILSLVKASPSGGGKVQFGWIAQIFRSGNSVSGRPNRGVIFPCCTIYFMRKDTGAIWAFWPQLTYAPETESPGWAWDIRWTCPTGLQIGIPINESCYEGDVWEGNVKNIFTEDDKGKTVDCVFEIYSNYINDRPKPDEPQKYQLYLRWPMNHMPEDSDLVFADSGGWVHGSANDNTSVAPGLSGYGGFDTRISVDDLCCFAFQGSASLYTLPLQSMWVRNDTGSSILWGPLAGYYFTSGAKGPFDKAIKAQIYRGDMPENKVEIVFDITKNMTGGPIYEHYGSAIPLNETDINTVIDFYFQYVSSTSL